MKHPKSGKSHHRGREFSDYFVQAFYIQELMLFFCDFIQSQSQNIFLQADCIRANVYSTILQVMFQFRANSTKHLSDDIDLCL